MAVACGGDQRLPVPTTASPVPTTSPAAVLTTLLIQGPPPAVGPGQTGQLKALARYNDGSERDVTAEATWTSTQPQIATVDRGTVKGLALGRTSIRVNYTNRSASLAMVIQPEGTFILSGNITEPVSVIVATASVAVVAGPPSSTTATSTGFYELFGVSGPVTVRASKPGYFDETKTLTVTQNQKLDLEIRPVVGPTSIAGTYTLTLTISPSCTVVPEDQRTRVYTATIAQDAARLTIQLSGANFVRDSRAEKSSFSGSVSGSTVTLKWGDVGFYFYYYYYSALVQELLPGGQILGIWGTTVAPAAPQTMSGSLVGAFTVREGNRTRSCTAADNRVVLARR